MADELLLNFDEDGKATLYDSTYDITIHCDNGKDQSRVIEALKRMLDPDVRTVSVERLYEELDKSEFIYLTKNDVRNIVEGLL